MRNRLSVMIMLALFICLGLVPTTSAQVAPLPAVGQTQKVFVSPSVLRVLQDQEKGVAPDVRVIVTFASRRNQNGAYNVEDISATSASILSALPAGSYEVVSTYKRIAAMSLKINAASLEALRTTPNVVAINQDQVIEQYMTEANAVTGVASVHTGGITGDGVVVAIIDSGVDSNGGVVHPALADDLIGQACFRTENDCIGGAGSAEDQGGHGTHVAGMITGPEGVAPDAQFYALKVFTTGTTSDTNILNALDFVIDTNTSTPGAIDLINMSLGGNNFSDQASCDANSTGYVDAFSTLNGQGVTIFVATGNDAEIDEIGSPGCASGAVGVGSTGDDTFSRSFVACTDNGAVDKVSCYSNATPVQGPGELVDLLAPGCLIVSTGLDEAVNEESCGTSMATPYAAGTAALLIEYLADNSLSMTPAQIEDHMENTGVLVSDYRISGSPLYPRVSPPNMIGSLAIDAPTDFQITAVTSNSVSTSWTGAIGATEYRVYASADGGAPVLAGTVTAPTTVFVDNAPVCGTLTYFVRAFDGSFESVNSNTDTDTARACPATPTGLSLTVVDADTHDLSWTDNNVDETSNILQRQMNDGGFSTYQTLGAGTTITYTDDALACGIYDYRAISERNGDLSTASNTVTRGVCGPANDNFANAEVVVADTPFTDTEANQSYGTEEAGDPIYSCHFGGAAPGFQGVWYSITPTVNTRVTVSTASTTIFAPEAGAPDTLVGIYTGSLGSLTEIACNDDISGSNFRSSVSSNLNAGTTYYVFVSQWVELPVGTTGNLVTAFTWSAPIVIPDNDLVANARVITGPSYTNTVTGAQHATVSVTDLAHTCAWNSSGTAIVPRVGTSTLWWTYTAPANGEIDVDTLSSTGSFTDTIMTIYTGTSGSFTVADCNDDEESAGTSLRSEILDLPVTAGTTYTVYISRWNTPATTTAGTVVLDLIFTASPGVIVTPTTADVAEGGATDTYTVVLATAPSADVTITVADDADCSSDVDTLTFTTADFSTPQTVTITAVDDVDSEGTHSCTISHTAASSDGNYNGISIASVTGTVTDNDTPPGVTVAPTTADVTEGGATDTYTVVLDTAPASDVTVTVTDDADCSTDADTLTFTTANFSTPQTVTVTAVNDAIAEGAHTCTISHTAASGDSNYNGISIASVTGSVTDNDTAGVTVDPTTADVTEGGATDTYTVVLTSQPTGDVTVTVTDDADCSASADTLTFTSANYATAQTVTVTAVNDAIAEGTHTCTISHTTSSGDSNYNGASVASVTGSVSDNETAGVAIDPATADVTEGGATDTYTVVLTSQPTGDVTITVTDDADCSSSADTLTFTSANYATAQTVTVTAVNDAIAEGVHTCTISHISVSSDSSYNGLTVVSVTGSVTDNDTAGVTVDPTTADVTEGGATDTYTVVLTSQPSGDVTITVTDDADCSASADTLTFTSANYATAQTVTVTAVDDTDVEGAHTCTITHAATSSDGSYNGVSVASVTGNVTDDEIAATTEELLTNGSFETAGSTNGIPQGWTVQSPSSDKRACPANVANVHSGTCAFKFTGSATDKSKLNQVVDLTGHTFTTGDTLTVSGFFKGNNVSARIKVMLFVTYTGNPTPVKTVMNVRRNVGYIQHTLPVYTLTSGDISQIKLVLNHLSSAGVIWVDDVSLIHGKQAVISRDGVLALPAPEGFRK